MGCQPMIYSTSRMCGIVSSGGAVNQFKDQKIGGPPLTFTAVVTAAFRFFAWICG